MGKKEKKSKSKKNSLQSTRSLSVQGSDPAIYNAVPRQGSDTEDTNATVADSSSPLKPAKQGSDKKKGRKKGRTKNGGSDDNIELQRKPSPVVAPLSRLTPKEYEFFEKVKCGDVKEVEIFLNQKFHNMSINMTDKTGYTVLHHAIRRQDEPMVLLLVQQAGIRLYDTLLHAIKEHNVQITKILLELYDKAASEEQKKRFMSSLANNQQNSPQISALVNTASTLNVAPPVSPISGRSGIQSSIRVETSGSGIGPPQGLKAKLKESTTKPKIIPAASVSPRMSESVDVDEMPFDSEFPQVFTPLMLAAQEGCVPLMELFYARDERLDSAEFSHNVGCECDICAKLEGEQDMTRAYQRYHLFKALTHPEYICFIARKEKVDPVNYAIQKIIKVRAIIEIDMAFNSLFGEFETRLEDFMSKLLQLCRNTTETEIFLSPKDAEEKERLPHLYPRLWYTVGLELKHFIAQPNAQNIVYKMWATDDWPDWDTYSWMYKCFNLFIRIPGFIFIAFILLLGQDSGVGHILSSPLSRFLTYIASYIVFMMLVLYQALTPFQRCNDGWFSFEIRDDECKERGPPRLGTEWFIVLYILSFYVSILKRQSVSWYWSMRWNWFELITQLTFTATIMCWTWAWFWTQFPENQELIMATDRLMWSHDCAEIFGECFLAISVLLASGRMLRFLGVHPELGPIQVALGKQIVDFISTALILVVVIFAFASGLMGLYMPYKGFYGLDKADHKREKAQENAFQSVTNAFKTLFFYLYEYGGPEVTNLLTWNVKNDTGAEDEIEHTVTHVTGMFLFMIYNTVGATMLFSMLSGYFASTFDRVMANVDVEWKFGRTELYLTFIKDTVLPPPFNILPTLKGLTQGIKFMGLLGKKDDPKASCSYRQCCFITSSQKTEKWRRLMKEYRKLILQLMYRYKNLREDYLGGEEATKDDILEIGEELAELKAMLKKAKGGDENSNDDGDDNDDFPFGGGSGAGAVTSTKGWSKTKHLVKTVGPSYLKNKEKSGGPGREQTSGGGGEETAGTSGTTDTVVTTQPSPNSSKLLLETSSEEHKVASGKLSLTFLPVASTPKRTSGIGAATMRPVGEKSSRGAGVMERSTAFEKFTDGRSFTANNQSGRNYNRVEPTPIRHTGLANRNHFGMPGNNPLHGTDNFHGMRTNPNKFSPKSKYSATVAVPRNVNNDDDTGVATDGSSRADYDSNTFSSSGQYQAPLRRWK